VFPSLASIHSLTGINMSAIIVNGQRDDHDVRLSS
jgi:hypothetical protein